MAYVCAVASYSLHLCLCTAFDSTWNRATYRLRKSVTLCLTFAAAVDASQNSICSCFRLQLIARRSRKHIRTCICRPACSLTINTHACEQLLFNQHVCLLWECTMASMWQCQTFFLLLFAISCIASQRKVVARPPYMLQTHGDCKYIVRLLNL